MGTPRIPSVDSDSLLFSRSIREKNIAHGTDDITVLKPQSDQRPGVYEWVHDSVGGYLLHLMTGQNAGNSASLIGMGVDNGGIGLFVNNKKTGVGISIQQNDSITSPTGFGFYGHQMSKTAPFMQIDQDNGARQAIVLVSAETSDPGKAVLEVVAANNPGGGGFIQAMTGALVWKSDVTAVGTGRFRAKQALAADGNQTIMEPAGFRLATATGAPNGYWQKRITGDAQSLLIQGEGGGQGGPDQATTWLTAIETKQVSPIPAGTQLGFYGVTPVARQALPTAATDASSTQSLVNAMRTALIGLGLVS